MAISNERILAITDNEVRLRVRANRRTDKCPIVHLSGTEFIARFLTHVLPPGFKRIRHYGLLVPAHKRPRLAAARAALGAPQPNPRVLETVADFLKRIDRLESMRCPHCGGRMVMAGTLAPVRPGQQARGRRDPCGPRPTTCPSAQRPCHALPGSLCEPPLAPGSKHLRTPRRHHKGPCRTTLRRIRSCRAPCQPMQNACTWPLPAYNPHSHRRAGG
ncbi:transposase [Denitromonas sp. IR12]|uniref:Transposase n=1 Tax=Denitromonas iodatirespirans TaxID=2795389 RepID=A0A944DFG4_DENI1|nr:transposase [Denitromonas iodatirespirans]